MIYIIITIIVYFSFQFFFSDSIEEIFGNKLTIELVSKRDPSIGLGHRRTRSEFDF